MPAMTLNKILICQLVTEILRKSTVYVFFQKKMKRIEQFPQSSVFFSETLYFYSKQHVFEKLYDGELKKCFTFFLFPFLRSLLSNKVVLYFYVKKALREKCPYSKFFWSVFSCIQTEYGEIMSISPYLVRMKENTDQKNSEYRHFLRSEFDICLQGIL